MDESPLVQKSPIRKLTDYISKVTKQPEPLPLNVSLFSLMN